ncbi:hypothetical protein [Niastella sp. OAS944]|uniref:hypothetical protein n=1 Tax=Niastella sp. OAS944 TaxID=2664089 RepID=UPI0034861CA1|nr:hypothetical protein [Chitinophagaceae bacterium OAS944]
MLGNGVAENHYKRVGKFNQINFLLFFKKATIIMKRARVILTSLVVLAVVGGALAFKAKSPVYCLYTTNVPAGAITCPKIRNIETTEPGSNIKWATTRTVLNCPTAVPTSHCTFTFNIVTDEP